MLDACRVLPLKTSRRHLAALVQQKGKGGGGLVLLGWCDLQYDLSTNSGGPGTPELVAADLDVEHSTLDYTRRAVSIIEEQQDGDKPLLLVLAFCRGSAPAPDKPYARPRRNRRSSATMYADCIPTIERSM